MEPTEQPHAVVEETERKANYRTIGITEVTRELHIFCHIIEDAPKLDQMTETVSTPFSLQIYHAHWLH